VLEEPPPPAPGGPARPWQLLVLSAKTAAALDAVAGRLAAFLEADPGVELADVAYTLAVGRRAFEHRRAVVCRDRAEAVALLAEGAPHLAGPERLRAVGELWAAGGEVDWGAFYAGQKRRRVPLPTYPFAGDRHWLEPPKKGTGAGVSDERLAACERAVAAAEAQLASARRILGAPRGEAAPSVGSEGGAGSDVEGRVGDILRELLEVEEVTASDDFFDLGGDSMIAVQLLARLRSAFGVELVHRDLLEAPVVGQIAELVRRRSASGSSSGSAGSSESEPARKVELPSNLVTLRAGGNGAAPLFLVHPVGGTVYFYRDLVKALDPPHPVYGIEARGADSREEPRGEIAGMAGAYLAALRAAQPAGPYRLAGASFGGLVAYEMACQLRAAGDQVAFLGMIDTPAPETVHGDFRSEEGLLGFLARSAADSSPELSLEHFDGLDLEGRRRYLLEHLQEHDPTFSGGMEELRAFLHLYLTHMRAMAEYRPAGYPGRIVFFRARERRPRYDPPHPELPWLDLAGEGVEVHVLPGDHLSVNFEPNVGALARRLRRHLE
jgi:thioesterase domain-containing protein/acyl carrier protein